MSDTLTVLRAEDGRRACKLFAGDIAHDYDAGYRFTFHQRPVGSLAGLSALLCEIEQDSQAFIIRGKPRGYIDSNAYVFRRCNGEDAAFEPQSVRFACIDIDNVEAPLGIAPCSAAAVEHVTSLLPAEFRDVSYIYQWSGSAGTAKAGRKVKVHLYWEFDRPVSDADMRRWAVCSGVADPKLYNPVQPHYIARPQFIDGAADPFEGEARTHLVRKSRDVVQLVLPELAQYARDPAPRTANDTDTVTDTDGRAIDGREGLLRDIRWRLLKSGHVKTKEEFADRVAKEFSDRAATGRTPLSENVYDAAAIATLCARDWDLYGKVQPEAAVAKLSASDATEALTTAVCGAFATPNHVALRATAGLGKSTITAREIVALADIERTFVEIYVPRKDEQRNWAERLRVEAAKAGKTVSILPIFGRDESNCYKHETAQHLAQRGLPIRPLLCASKNNRLCPAHDVCAYLAQFSDSQPGIRIYSHAHLGMPRPKALEKPRIIVIDESFHGTLCKTTPFTTDDLRLLRGFRCNQLLFDDGYEAVSVLKAVSESLESREPLLEALTNHGLLPDALRAAAAKLGGHLEFPNIWPDSRPADVMKVLKTSRYRTGAITLAVLRTLARELETGRRDSHSVVRHDGHTFNLCVRHSTPRLDDIATVLVLDADCELENLRPFFPDIECKRIDARENCLVHQVEDRSFSRASIWPSDGERPDERVVAKLVAFVRKHRRGRTLIVTYKNFVSYLAEQLDGVDFAHFGGLRGSNEWETCDTAFVIGRQWLPDDAIDKQARALHFDSETELRFGPPVMRRHAVGLGVLTSYDDIDPRIHAVRCATREAETRQALARLRTIHSKGRKRVYILSSQPVGVAVDALIRFEPRKAERVFAALGGFLPFRGADLAKLAGNEFESVEAATKWRDKASNTPQALKVIIAGAGESIRLTSYRPAGGTGRASQLLVSPTLHPFPEISLAEKLNGIIDPLNWEPDALPGLPTGLRSFSLDGPRKSWLVMP